MDNKKMLKPCCKQKVQVQSHELAARLASDASVTFENQNEFH